MARFPRIVALIQKVDSNNGILTVSMKQLRNAVDHGRLGPRVLGLIQRELRALGLSWYPVPLPNNQDARVRLYKSKSALSILVDATLRIGGVYDDILRHVAQDKFLNDLARQRFEDA